MKDFKSQADQGLKIGQPILEQAREIFQLVAASPPLDLNSFYLYALQASHFADTSVVATSKDGVVGFMSAYLRPDVTNELFIWQVAVNTNYRGQGIGQRMLADLVSRPHLQQVKNLSATIGPSNEASLGLFRGFAAKHDLVLEQGECFLGEQAFPIDQHHEPELYWRVSAKSEKSIYLALVN